MLSLYQQIFYACKSEMISDISEDFTCPSHRPEQKMSLLCANFCRQPVALNHLHTLRNSIPQFISTLSQNKQYGECHTHGHSSLRQRRNDTIIGHHKAQIISFLNYCIFILLSLFVPQLVLLFEILSFT